MMMSYKELVPRELPQTGQRTNYRYGDDADFESGWQGQGAAGAGRFRDNGDNTTTDFATGLMWVADPKVIGAPFNASINTWNAAIDACLALNYAGHTDWRLPSVLELLSLIDFEKGAGVTTIYDTYFPNTEWAGKVYWSSTTYKTSSTQAHMVGFFSSGETLQDNKDGSGPLPEWVRPVRGGVTNGFTP
jgi:hypothetical protein